MFTIVQDGGESTLRVASQIPYSQVTYYRDYLTGAGYVTTGVQFKDVGTSLKVGAAILPGNQIKVRLTPTISWLSAEQSGVIEVNEASTELVVPSGQPVMLGGAGELTSHPSDPRSRQRQRDRDLDALTATIQ
jgi:type II secretory pathway component GspD/PulD (secretin)